MEILTLTKILITLVIALYTILALTGHFEPFGRRGMRMTSLTFKLFLAASTVFGLSQAIKDFTHFDSLAIKFFGGFFAVSSLLFPAFFIIESIMKSSRNEVRCR
ncbi:hypothetical protein A3L04_05535 [Thermococcus chitonophagus]|uniref:Uncharacterized protein n=2 Tax=Thermococcus chitonophagus TaxID=54262 RepID=A0A2Z2NF84_9EURY|nr:hypothetical protein A3L04_05535 [Thermococcus chitonophagus]